MDMNQDNPFAKGVSINQDIVYDQENIPGDNADLPLEKLWNDTQKEYLDANPALRNELLALGREEE